MQNDRLFIGDIMQCTKHEPYTLSNEGEFLGEHRLNVDSFGYDLGSVDEYVYIASEVLKVDATLIRTRHGYYVDVEGLSLSDIAYLESSKVKVRGAKSGRLFMLTSASGEGDLFVDGDSIRPYAPEQLEKGSSSILGIQKEQRAQSR